MSLKLHTKLKTTPSSTSWIHPQLTNNQMRSWHVRCAPSTSYSPLNKLSSSRPHPRSARTGSAKASFGWPAVAITYLLLTHHHEERLDALRAPLVAPVPGSAGRDSWPGALNSLPISSPSLPHPLNAHLLRRPWGFGGPHWAFSTVAALGTNKDNWALQL